MIDVGLGRSMVFGNGYEYEYVHEFFVWVCVLDMGIGVGMALTMTMAMSTGTSFNVFLRMCNTNNGVYLCICECVSILSYVNGSMYPNIQPHPLSLQAYKISLDALKDLIDSPASPGETLDLKATCSGVRGVKGVRELKARQSGVYGIWNMVHGILCVVMTVWRINRIFTCSSTPTSQAPIFSWR